MFLAVRLAKEGYYDGDPEKVLSAPVNIVQSIIEFENFTVEYEEEYLALNQPGAAT